MSFFSKLFGRKAPPPPEPTIETVPEPVPALRGPADALSLLSEVGQPAGPDPVTASRLLAEALAGPRQRDAIDAIGRAMARGRVPENLRVACAHALVARGDLARAISFLDEVSDATALMLKADLLHDDGQIARAVSVIERVLARDIDAPGARERHVRWRRHLAPRAERPRSNDDVTMAVPTVQKSPFRIVREVARGGAGSIYEAKDDVLGRTVALKVYHRADVDKAQVSREARVATRLAGPGVVRVFDIDLEQGWLALEWMRTGSVREVLKSGDASALGEPIVFLRNLALALRRVHEAGWVHADVKPANVLMRSPSEPVLSDFGIAVRSNEPSLGGSAGFLSPERLAGSPLCPADDIYGFGRIVEDFVLAAGGALDAFRPLAERCMAPPGVRPSDGAELVSVLG